LLLHPGGGFGLGGEGRDIPVREDLSIFLEREGKGMAFIGSWEREEGIKKKEPGIDGKSNPEEGSASSDSLGRVRKFRRRCRCSGDLPYPVLGGVPEPQNGEKKCRASIPPRVGGGGLERRLSWNRNE